MKRFNIFVPKGKGTKGGWALLVEAVREMEPGSEESQSGEEVVRVKIDNRPSSERLEKLAQCLVGSWDPMLGRGDDLRSWGTQMSKLWGLKGNLGLAKLEDGKALLEFEIRAEAEKALKNGVISISGFDVRLEKWSQRTGCVMEEEKKREAWVKILGLPISLWDRDTLCKIGGDVGNFWTSTPKRRGWRSCSGLGLGLVVGNQADVKNVQADDKGRTLAAAGEGEDAGGGWDVEADSWGGATHGLPHGLGGSHLGLQGMERMQGGPLVMAFGKPCGPGGLNLHSPLVDHVGPKERVDFRRPKSGTQGRCWTGGEGPWWRPAKRAELIQNERSLTDLALAEEAMRYDKVSDCLVSGTPSLLSPFFGRTPVGEYCDFSGDDKERDEGENPIK
ncbi:hypothetical protein CK203_110051 [Vitis vinifera]|uniref:DUF4283 domain-containing protein n=1 Tax=Vitis vinifera TaxID=29760 RepID=A0A438EAC6_VITVI|nr:hypothetical protein CK203_110051 [Vitis vinifera]